MDGVTCDIFGALNPIFPHMKQHDKNSVTPEDWAHMYANYPNFFRDMKPMPDFFKLMVGIANLGYHDFVMLSALPNPKHGPKITIRTVRDKTFWLERNLPKAPAIFCLRSHKADYANNESILIDDSPENIEAWVKKGGFGILHESAKVTLDALSALR